MDYLQLIARKNRKAKNCSFKQGDYLTTITFRFTWQF